MGNSLEIWKPVVGYEPLYEVSNLGNIKSLVKRIVRKNGADFYKKEHPMRICDNGKGYKNLGLTKNGCTKTQFVHRIVCQAFNPNPDNLPEVNHLDGDKANNKASNLEWTTRALNNLHAHRTGLNKGYDKSGNRNPRFVDGKRSRVNEKKECAECGEYFIAKFSTTLFCSKLCSGRYKVKQIALNKQINNSKLIAA